MFSAAPKVTDGLAKSVWHKKSLGEFFLNIDINEQ